MASNLRERFRRKQLFKLGTTDFSPGVERLMHEGRLEPMPYLERHMRGDWGDVENWQWQGNNAALLSGDRLESFYQVHRELALTIITEADRSATLIRMPHER